MKITLVAPLSIGRMWVSSKRSRWIVHFIPHYLTKANITTFLISTEEMD